MNKICPAVRDRRPCLRANCSLVHDVYRCRVCKAPFALAAACLQHEKSGAAAHRAKFSCDVCSISGMTKGIYKNHVQGKKHEKKLASTGSYDQVVPFASGTPLNHIQCTTCDRSIPQASWNAHIQGQKHRKKTAKATPRETVLSVTPKPPDHVQCMDCERSIPRASWNAHTMGQRHILKQTRQSFQNALSATEGEKHGTSIDGGPVDFGTIDGAETTVIASKQIQISNRSQRTVALTKVNLSSRGKMHVFSLAIVLLPSRTYDG